ncbi:hypothetical protein DFA_11760 [Cavenderia fasciculata]|uniref:Protein DD3-3 n=1 Tax=Cavenderia fasciculata TaxID=261658 RepID=F4QE52_CACFS|nr:uncharacterized protein DFA_11760 [Cavenderia fasciculata]EGG13999.1 hypothetical protein DFA_11760 [Cavenderia fasciculata]|eukprot:XP_004350707.1 hypothetical protein DFA_11760 [Cavenderia fasciculata]
MRGHLWLISVRLNASPHWITIKRHHYSGGNEKQSGDICDHSTKVGLKDKDKDKDKEVSNDKIYKSHDRSLCVQYISSIDCKSQSFISFHLVYYNKLAFCVKKSGTTTTINVTLLACCMAVVYADIYGHSPPHSNNRNNEESTNRANANRLFNSQNNDKGGYCRGGMFNWYEKSYLPIEWTNQHGCGSDQTTCSLILQYMCTDVNAPAEEAVRDGTTTDTIPNTLDATKTMDTADYKYGLHEGYYYYQNCSNRQRNTGLWTATQNPGKSALSTRQQPGTTRYGFECPEERDYYPYWAPTPWKDIAIFTTETSRCKMYKRESQNDKDKYYCKTNDTSKLAPFDFENCNATGGEWVNAYSHDIGAPGCYEAAWNHVNHLGISLENGKYNTYNWSLPHSGMEPCILTGTCRCVLRIRYNISNSQVDYDFDASYNGANSTVKTDPLVAVSGVNLTIEVNTAQYGRTFEDRTHSFNIIPRPKSLKDAKIWNLLVKGKRGNIVQVFPAIEYQFSPSQLHMKVNEYIHFQWTGCDTNPNGNAGEGIDQTDRSNIVQIDGLNENMPAEDVGGDTALFRNEEDRIKFASLNQKGCKSYEQLMADNNNDRNQVDQDPQNCFRLNAADKHFDGGVFKMSKTGSYYYMSTRNNNFSNRDQKGAIHVDPLLRAWQIALIAVGGTLFVGLSATAGSLLFARKHPHSGAARFFQKIPLLRRAIP